MSVNDMDEATIQYAYAYGEWQYKEGYEAGYKAGLKKGKSIGSHQAYDYFIRKEHWTDAYDLSGEVWCPMCGHDLGGEDLFDGLEDDDDDC